jgi:hypothetical protein
MQSIFGFAIRLLKLLLRVPQRTLPRPHFPTADAIASAVDTLGCLLPKHSSSQSNLEEIFKCIPNFQNVSLFQLKYPCPLSEHHLPVLVLTVT